MLTRKQRLRSHRIAMTLTTLCMALAILILIGGCASTSPTSSCYGFEEISLTANDMAVISRSLKEQIVAHNEFGERHCGWSN